MAMDRARVYLTTTPLSMAETPLKYHPPMVPMGLAYLAAALEREFTNGAYDETTSSRASSSVAHSGRVRVRDNMLLSYYAKYRWNELVVDMQRFFEDCDAEDQYIGLSVLSDGMPHAIALLKGWRRFFPKASIIVGGPHATLFPYDFYLNIPGKEGPLADYVVRHEGENALRAIVAGAVGTEADLEAASEHYGLDLAGSDYQDPSYRVIDGGTYRGEPGAAASDAFHVLDGLPIPAYGLFADGQGVLPYPTDARYRLDVPAANINTSRGCPMKCAFCTVPWLVEGYRCLSPDRILQIAEYLIREFSIRGLFFREDNLLWSIPDTEQNRWPDIKRLCQGLKAYPLTWAIEARADDLNRPSGDTCTRIQTMADAGLRGIYVGVESGYDHLLQLYCKGEHVSDMIEAISSAHRAGVAVVASCVYGDPDVVCPPNCSPAEDMPQSMRDEIAVREEILRSTRQLLDTLQIPDDHREEYALVGIPRSLLYDRLLVAMENNPEVAEYYDKTRRYIYPRGFRWWSHKLYELDAGVRPYVGYAYNPSAESTPER